MAKLPYTYTICPDQEAPKQFTASCTQMGELLKNSVDGDLTINNRMPQWDSWTNRPLRQMPIEEAVSEMVKRGKNNA
jgi:hypothetical protein